MKHIRLKHPLRNAKERLDLVNLFSTTIEGRRDSTFEPYNPQPGDQMFWTLDSGNNWKLHFLNETDFTIRYRYNDPGSAWETALLNWLQGRRIDFTLVQPERPGPTDAELREILLTCDGRGREAKALALDLLLKR